MHMGLSAATPPVRGQEKNSTLEGCQMNVFGLHELAILYGCGFGRQPIGIA